MSQPPRKLSAADLKKLRKVATGPLLGPAAGRAATEPGPGVPVTIASLGHFDRVRATLDRVREQG
jgi:hypothetical protein